MSQLDEAIRERDELRAQIAAFNDLRGRAIREVHRDDAVIITGEEYLRKSWAAIEWAEVQAERERS